MRNSHEKGGFVYEESKETGFNCTLVVMAVIGTGNISAQADYNWKPKKVSIAQSAKRFLRERSLKSERK